VRKSVWQRILTCTCAWKRVPKGGLYMYTLKNTAAYVVSYLRPRVHSQMIRNACMCVKRWLWAGVLTYKKRLRERVRQSEWAWTRTCICAWKIASAKRWFFVLRIRHKNMVHTHTRCLLLSTHDNHTKSTHSGIAKWFQCPVIDYWFCFYYFARNGLVALLETLCARKSIDDDVWAAVCVCMIHGMHDVGPCT